LAEALRAYLDEATERIIREEVFKDTAEAKERWGNGPPLVFMTQPKQTSPLLVARDLMGLAPPHGIAVDEPDQSLQGIVAALEYDPVGQFLAIDQDKVADEGVHPRLSGISDAGDV
jgi:hypothetical protein